jgi:hypothetical protein
VLTVVDEDRTTPIGSSLLDEIVRQGARRMLTAALEAEVDARTAESADEHDGEGRRVDGEALTRRVGSGEHRRPAREQDERRVVVTERLDAQGDPLGVDRGHRITSGRRRTGASRSMSGSRPAAPVCVALRR